MVCMHSPDALSTAAQLADAPDGTATHGERAQEQLGDAAIELLQRLIRLATVNDGSPESGQEINAVLTLKAFFDEAAAPIEMHILEARPGRASLIARIRGSKANAPSLGLVGHLDVVTVDEARWQRDPFGAEIIDGEIWGRGSVDMLYLTASFAVVFREVAEAVRDGATLEGDLVFMGVADEEGGSTLGMQWLMAEHPEIVRVDAVLTEAGGMRIGEKVSIAVAEKGSAGRRLHISGASRHASVPYGSDNPINTLAEVVRRISSDHAEHPTIHALWREFVGARIEDPKLAGELTNADTMTHALPALGPLAGYAHAVTRTTVSPTQVRAGVQHNMIPNEATVDLDVRTLPGVTDDDVDAVLEALLGDLSESVRIERLLGWGSSASPVDSDLYALLSDVIREHTGRESLPIMAAGGSDARFFRYLGVPAYGFGVLSDEWTYEQYRERIHADNERIDEVSVRLTLSALRTVVRQSQRLSTQTTEK